MIENNPCHAVARKIQALTKRGYTQEEVARLKARNPNHFKPQVRAADPVPA